MFKSVSRSALLRVVAVALGTAMAIPAVAAETEGSPLNGPAPRAAFSAWSGPASAARPAPGPAMTGEPGSVGDLRGASGLAASRTPLAAIDLRFGTDVTAGAN